MSEERCVNPFYHRIHLRPYDWPLIIIGSILLAPIRIIIVITLFLIASFLSKLCNQWLARIDRDSEPDLYHEWRIRFKNIIRHLFRAILFVVGFYRVTIIQKGDINKEKDAPIYIMAPHTSLFDILAGVALQSPSSVAKADIVNIPLFGNIFKLSDPVLVERDSKHSRHDVFKKVSQVIKYSKIVFFPEGTCSNHRGMLQFKNGAFKLGYPVVPIALRFNQFGAPDTLIWTWDGPNTFWSIWLTLCRWRTDLELTKLPVYTPSELEKKDPDLYARNVAKVLVKELGLPCLFYSYDDSRYFKYRSFRSSTCVKFMKLVDKIRKIHSTSLSSSNGKHNKSSKQEMVPYTEYLSHLIDKIFNNIVDLNATLDQERLLAILDIASVPDINESYSVKELMLCFQRQTFDDEGHDPFEAKLYHLKAVAHLVDLREPDLWHRLRNAYDTFNEASSSLDTGLESLSSPKQLEILLWLSLGLNKIDDQFGDILSFG
ncbi:lysophosphatidylcholine acyltransferase 1-like protein [Euroglyphus maynei]|uniref:Lysophosphatidylcholine acyltransferase 1-like protein n=1 Tax=Euroglyphus maynei TaxID=6958 RepID=A0A1Y3B753_EURMA|nr:lysophosphatidylcholine acyltransferase 1-like protein [Euroglyphus maynei]